MLATRKFINSHTTQSTLQRKSHLLSAPRSIDLTVPIILAILAYHPRCSTLGKQMCDPTQTQYRGVTTGNTMREF